MRSAIKGRESHLFVLSERSAPIGFEDAVYVIRVTAFFGICCRRPVSCQSLPIDDSARPECCSGTTDCQCFSRLPTIVLNA